MSIWTLVDCTVHHPIEAHFSLRKAIEATFDERSIEELKTHKTKTQVVSTCKFWFCDEGMSAAMTMQRFAKTLTEVDKTRKITALIRF